MSKHYREPIKHTCPDIDRLIKNSNEILSLIKGYSNIEDIEELKLIIGDIENLIYGFDSELEDLRRSNDTLRSWGIEEANNYDKLELKYEELKEIANEI